MVFRLILALVALLIGIGACAPLGDPSQTAGPGASHAGVPTLPRQIERDVGPAYPDPALQAYVDGVGQKLIARSKLSGNYRFVVLDTPIANAHAVSGYVFVTRGLLALLDDEAELAAALGHEVGHLVERHGAQRARARQGVLDAAVDAAVSTGSITVGRSVARDGLLALRRYSREQELEADKIGVAMLVRAGYRGSAMVSLIDKLRLQSQLDCSSWAKRPIQQIDAAAPPRRIQRPSNGGRRWRESLTLRQRASPIARSISRRSTACRLMIRRRKVLSAVRALSIRCSSSALAHLVTSACSTTRTAYWVWAATARCCSFPAPTAPCPVISPSGCEGA